MEQSASQHNGLRVILVGPTGMDAVLRHEPGLELIRARTPLDALGELADPIDELSPTRAVVIVDPGVEPTAVGAGDLAEFLAGLRRVDPGVRVLRVARNGDAAPAGYDGQVEPTTDADGLRRFIEGGAPVTGQAIEPKPAPIEPEPEPLELESAPIEDEADVPEPPTAESEPVPMAPLDELAMLRKLSAGESVLESAMDQMRARTGCEDLEYAPLDAERAELGAHSSAPVKIGEETVGSLISATMAPAALAPEAEWLGAWLELERHQADLRDAAYQDPLTGAWNRRYFDDFLPSAIDEARRHRRDLTVLLFDIDDFKRFNDEHGHAAGDEILTECVRLLNTAVRPTDKVCRIGGDEFAVIFYDPQGPREPDSRHPTSVFDIAERFRRLVCEARFRKLGDDAPGKLTISGGLATYPWDGRTAEELIERADQLALDGKRQGKNVIAIGPGQEEREG